MKIVVDDKIPYIRETLSKLADEVVYIKGGDICADDVRDADALIVRTRTRCDEALLGGSKVSFVATATIGFDHIDVPFMKKAGISWMNCPGCNSSSVAQYVRSVLTLLRLDRKMTLKGKTMAVIGCGHVGSKVVVEAVNEGMRMLISDPPLQEFNKPLSLSAETMARGMVEYATMETIAREADVITYHVPLTCNNRHRTIGLADTDFFRQLKKHPVIINTSRGPVVNNEALLHAIYINKVGLAVIDTWENEPNINLQLLNKVWIGTPHIAGYSADGKVNADNMVIEGLCQHFGLALPPRIEPPLLPNNAVTATDEDLRRLQLYNPMADSQRLKAHPERFEELRGSYPLRRERL